MRKKRIIVSLMLTFAVLCTGISVITFLPASAKGTASQDDSVAVLKEIIEANNPTYGEWKNINQNGNIWRAQYFDSASQKYVDFTQSKMGSWSSPQKPDEYYFSLGSNEPSVAMQRLRKDVYSADDFRVFMSPNKPVNGCSRLAVAYYVPEDGEYDIGTNPEFDVAMGTFMVTHPEYYTQYAGKDDKYSIAVYKNNEKIYPLDAEYVYATGTASAKMKTIKQTLKAGDVIRYVTDGATSPASDPWMKGIAFHPMITPAFHESANYDPLAYLLNQGWSLTDKAVDLDNFDAAHANVPADGDWRVEYNLSGADRTWKPMEYVYEWNYGGDFENLPGGKNVCYSTPSSIAGKQIYFAIESPLNGSGVTGKYDPRKPMGRFKLTTAITEPFNGDPRGSLVFTFKESGTYRLKGNPNNPLVGIPDREDLWNIYNQNVNLNFWIEKNDVEISGTKRTFNKFALTADFPEVTIDVKAGDTVRFVADGASNWGGWMQQIRMSPMIVRGAVGSGYKETLVWQNDANTEIMGKTGACSYAIENVADSTEFTSSHKITVTDAVAFNSGKFISINNNSMTAVDMSGRAADAYISLWVKATKPNLRYKVALMNSDGTKTMDYKVVINADSKWQNIVVPLNAMVGFADFPLSDIKSIAFYADESATQKLQNNDVLYIAKAQIWSGRMAEAFITDNLKVLGTQIRTSDNGLRFCTELKMYQPNKIIVGDRRYTIKESGTLVSPKNRISDNLSDMYLQKQGDIYVANTANTYIKKVETKHIYERRKNSIVYTAVITNIPDNQLDRNLCVRAYVVCIDDETKQEIVFYSGNSRTCSFNYVLQAVTN